MLTSAQPSAMGGPSDRAVQVSQIKPVAKGGGKKGSAKDAEGNPVVNYPTTLEEPKVYCLQGTKFYSVEFLGKLAATSAQDTMAGVLRSYLNTTTRS